MCRSFVLNELARNLLGTVCRVGMPFGGAKLNISTPPERQARRVAAAIRRLISQARLAVDLGALSWRPAAAGNALREQLICRS